MKRIVTIIAMSSLFLTAIATPSSRAQDYRNHSKSVPIPKPRPQIVKVSPAYIDSLKQRDQREFDSPLPFDGDDASLTQSAAIQDKALQHDLIEKSLISFSLTPEQSTVDKALPLFLRDHAHQHFDTSDHAMVEILAYSSLNNNAASQVKMSLARALDARAHLIAHGIPASRIKITPRAQRAEDDDRIDLIFYEKAQ